MSPGTESPPGTPTDSNGQVRVPVEIEVSGRNRTTEFVIGGRCTFDTGDIAVQANEHTRLVRIWDGADVTPQKHHGPCIDSPE